VILAPLPENTDVFDVVLADPPWSYYGNQAKWGAAAKFYPTMTDSDILDLPMESWLAPRGVLFLWATGPRLDFAFQCLEWWGLHYRGMAFVWVKTKQDGTPIGAQGTRPSIVKPLTEFVLAASRVPKGRPMKLASEAVVQTVLAPKGPHSAKPGEVQERIESLYPNARKAELFARTDRPGWSCYGDELVRLSS
jgi:N6-adenosine-specific RNA methylase IME4